MENSKSNKIDPFERLYTAKWNVPKAAVYLGVTNEECKTLFSEFCREKRASAAANAEY
jgi:hypothetical protein